MLKKILFLLAINPVIFTKSFINKKPAYILLNKNTDFGIITGVDFKPKTNIFAATYFHNQEVVLYNLQKNGKPNIRQILKNPESQLSYPHGIAFHPKGKFLAITHYGNHSISIFKWNSANNRINEVPVSIFTPSAESKVHNSHGIAFSPKGDCLAVTYCDCEKEYEEKVIFYPFDQITGQISNNHFFILQENIDKICNPKGVLFSPDGNCVIISMCDGNTLNIHSIINKEKYIINPKPHQVIKNPIANLYRPEDIKFSTDGNYLAVTNSNNNTINIYGYNKKYNIIHPKPVQILQNPESELLYPHGLAFCPNNKFLVITNFGIPDGPQTEAILKREDKINFYRIR